MQNSRFQALTARFSPYNLRTSFRRSASTSSKGTASNRNSYSSANMSPVSTINSIIFRQPSIVDMEEERKSFGSGLDILEPRPLVYWGGLEERMGSF